MYLSQIGCGFLWCSNPMSARPNSARKTDQSTQPARDSFKQRGGTNWKQKDYLAQNKRISQTGEYLKENILKNTEQQNILSKDKWLKEQHISILQLRTCKTDQSTQPARLRLLQTIQLKTGRLSRPDKIEQDNILKNILQQNILSKDKWIEE